MNKISRNLYLRYLLSLMLGLFIGRTILAPLDYHLPHLSPKKEIAVVKEQGRMNSTLGTAAIITLNAPSRPDRRDIMSLTASLTNLKLTFMGAWTTKPVEKAMPNEHNPNLKDVEYACWRSHADAWRKIVEGGWTTAMILEDDVDWDGGIYESMQVAWEALKNFTNDPHAATTATSYDNLKKTNVDGISFILDFVWIYLRRDIIFMKIHIRLGHRHGG